MVRSQLFHTVRSILFVISFVLISIWLIGCNNNGSDNTKKEETKANDEGGGEAIGERDIYDFYFINRAPEATEKHALDKLIKIHFSSGNIAIDIGNNELYETPRFSTNGVATFEEPLEFDDKKGLLEILERYRVQEWKEDYTTEDPDTYDDGYSWMMLLQFEDGTVERYQGSGPYKEDVIPKNFDAFTNELGNFVGEKIKEHN